MNSVRNRIEDGHVLQKLITTEKMLADIDTKVLDISQFERLRDKLPGYARVDM